MRWWHPKDLKTLARWAYDWVTEDIWDTLTDTAYRSWTSWHIGLRYVKAVHPFKRTFSGWTWTVNSLEAESHSARWERAEQLAKERGFEEPDYSDWIDKLGSTRDNTSHAAWYAAVREIEEGLKLTWQKADTVRYVETSEDHCMVRLSPYLWVNKHDPTVFVLDEDLVPFDMKSGWSEEAMCTVIQEWFKEMLGETPRVRFVECE
jgi:hypothetical protein